MKAILNYGGFTKEVNVPDARDTIYILKPLEEMDVMSSDTESLDEITNTRLEFRLNKSPRIGEPLEYVFVRES